MRSLTSEELSTGGGVREAVRRRRFAGSTSTVAPGFIQADLTILPRRHALDFLAYCDTNSAALPLLAVSEPGAPFLPGLGADLDVRTDVPGYLVFEQGVQTAHSSQT
jgi:uncharacterized protein YcsI (UPF0317 family)